MSDNITKHMTFPRKLVESLEKKADQFGLSFAEYIRHIAVKDIEKERSFLDFETEKKVGQAYDDLRNGRFKVLADTDSVINYVKIRGSGGKKGRK